MDVVVVDFVVVVLVLLVEYWCGVNDCYVGGVDWDEDY